MNKLTSKLAQQVRCCWKRSKDNKESTIDWELEALVGSLTNLSFRFSPMYRSWIPKPNKPGQLRPITQPNKKDIIVMNSISLLVNLAYKDIFFYTSHGFRKGRGPITFFSSLHRWGPMDRLVKSDVVKCFDNIDHDLLLSFLLEDLGQSNSDFSALISHFLRTEILDSKGNDYSNREKGIPQGSSLSPVLMNVYLHRLDVEICHLMETESTIRYARYADDMIFAILQSNNSEVTYKRFRDCFTERLERLKLRESSIEILRTQPRKTRVLGLITFLKPNGILETRAPFKRWRSKLTLHHLLGQIDSKQKIHIYTFLRILRPAIKTRIALSVCCSSTSTDEELISYFTNLSCRRINEFQKRKKRHPKQEELIELFMSRIPHWVQFYKSRLVK